MSKTVNANKIITCNPLVFNMMYTWRWPLNVIVIIFPIIYQKQGKKTKSSPKCDICELFRRTKIQIFSSGKSGESQPLPKESRGGMVSKAAAVYTGAAHYYGGKFTTGNRQATNQGIPGPRMQSPWHMARSEEGGRSDAEQTLIYQRHSSDLRKRRARSGKTAIA